MNPDRMILFLMLFAALATIMQVPPVIREGLGIVCGVQILRSHRRALQTVPVRRRSQF